MTAYIHHIRIDFERFTDEEERAYEIRNSYYRDEDVEITAEEFETLYEYVGHDEDATIENVSFRWENCPGASEAFIEAETRSLMTGDIIETDEGMFLVESFGFVRLDSLKAELEEQEAAVRIAHDGGFRTELAANVALEDRPAEGTIPAVVDLLDADDDRAETVRELLR